MNHQKMLTHFVIEQRLMLKTGNHRQNICGIKHVVTWVDVLGVSMNKGLRELIN